MPIFWCLQTLQAWQFHSKPFNVPCMQLCRPSNVRSAILPVGCRAGGGEGEAHAMRSAARR